MDPSARSHSVCFVLDHPGEVLVEVFEDRVSKDLSVNSSHTVYSVGTNNGKESHSYFLLVSFFN